MRETLGDNHAVLPGREYIMDKLTLSVVTGLTLNHSRMLLGYCLGYGENHDDEKSFLQFMVENGCSVMNSPSTVFMSDRGATSSPIDDILPLAIHHFCPKHLERNLQDLKFDVKVQKKFWAARCAKDALTYEKRMQELEEESSKAAAYLRPIPNWQVYKVLAKGGILHELKSDNLVEGMFSSLRLARQAGSPVFVANEITVTALKIQRHAQVLAEESASDVAPRALKLLTLNFIEAEKFCVEVASNHQAIVRFSGACRKRSPGCNVNLKKKTCDCQVWAQSGAPCVHAAAFILKMYGNRCSSEYFYEFCLSTRLKKMFDDYEAPSVVDVASLSDTMSVIVPPPPKITPRTVLVPLRGQSGLRFAARSEKKGGGGLTASDAKKRGAKLQCPLCTKHIAQDNHSHKGSRACAKHALRVKAGLMYQTGAADAYLRELDHNSDEGEEGDHEDEEEEYEDNDNNVVFDGDVDEFDFDLE